MPATGVFRTETKTGAGPLREKIAFDLRVDVQDGYGNKEGGWVEQFSAAGALLALRGGEAVQAARLEGNQPFILTLRYSARAAAVTADWRCRDARTGAVYAVAGEAVPRPRKDYIDILVTAGAAA